MNDTVRPRRRHLALLMSLVLPGFGQLYNGELNKAIWIILAFCFVTVGTTPFVSLHVPARLMMPAVVAGLVLELALWIFSMRDAWRTAARSGQHVLQPWQKSGIYVAVFILLNGLLLPALLSKVRDRQVESFRIPSSSMVPTVLPGDLVFADKRYNCFQCRQGVKRGDIVVFTFPNDRTLYFVKRVIGLPGERIEVRNGEVMVNGRRLALHGAGTPEGVDSEGDGSARWRVSWAAADPRLPDTDLVVPAGEVFLMGDNRNLSEDSRAFGPVPLRDVVGKLRQVWFSTAEGKVRWSRMGAVLQ
jgi:signal peptidase I